MGKAALPRVCWTCRHYVPSRVPLEELEEYLHSEEYAKICDIWVEPSDLTWENYEYPVVPETGEIRERFYLDFTGYCKALHKLVRVTNSSDQYTLRELVPPLSKILIQCGGGGTTARFYICFELDALMKEEFDKWFEWAMAEMVAFGSLKIAESIQYWMENAALSYTVHDSEYHRCDLEVFYDEVLGYNPERDDYEVVQKFQRPVLLLFKLTPSNCDWYYENIDECIRFNSLMQIIDTQLDWILNNAEIIYHENSETNPLRYRTLTY